MMCWDKRACCCWGFGRRGGQGQTSVKPAPATLSNADALLHRSPGLDPLLDTGAQDGIA